MKSNISFPNTPRPRKYPYLGLHRGKHADPTTPLVVLFTEPKTGTEVIGHYVGKTTSTWSESDFVKFDGHVHLVNED